MLAISAVEFVQCRWVALALIVVVGGQVVTLPDHHPPIGLLCYSSRSIFENTCWPLESVSLSHQEGPRTGGDRRGGAGGIGRGVGVVRAGAARDSVF